MKYLFLISWIIIVSATVTYHQSSPLEVISWDVYGYYVYLPSIFIYGDITSYGFVSSHFDNYNISANLYQLKEIQEGIFAPIYTLGMAILWFPFFFIAHIITHLTGIYPADGMSSYYQWAIVIACWFYALIGLYYLQKTLQHFFSPLVVTLTILSITLGTNYFHYAAFESGMSHSYLFSLYTVLLYYTIKWHENPKASFTIIIGLCIGLLSMCRPSEVISLLIPLLYGIHNIKTLKRKIQLVRKHIYLVFLLALTGILAISPQIIYWKTAFGVFIFNGYAEHHFDWLQPHLWDGLFSYRKGWLVYTPLMYLGILGFYWLWKNHKSFFLPLFVFTSINIYIVLSWHIWWYASSFGARGLIQSYAVLSIPMAALLQHVYQQSWRGWWYGLLVLMWGALSLNQFQDWQYRHKILVQDETSKTYYWQTFGKTERELNDLTYIDINEKLPDNFTYKLQNLVSYEVDTTSSYFLLNQDIKGELQAPTREFAGTIHWEIPEKSASTYQNKWIAVSAMVNLRGDQFSKYHSARLVCSIERNGKTLKWKGLRFQRILPPYQWKKVAYFIQLPDHLQAKDLIKVCLWNTSPDTLWFSQTGIDVLY